MSIEIFFEKHPADSLFAESVSWPKVRNDRSPIRFMSDILIREGQQGLKVAGLPFRDAHALGNLREIERIRGQFLNNASAIYLGVSLRTIEEILINGHFDHDEFNARLKLAYADTHLEPLAIDGKGLEVLDKDQMRAITQVAMADKTFAAFFKQDFQVLPESLQQFLSEEGIITTMRNLILPKYEERARLLISNNGQRPR
jgi:hypothetical protein